MNPTAFRIPDQVRLEVQADDVATTNLVKNPVPDQGTYLWGTPSSNTLFTATGTAAAPVFREGFSGAMLNGQYATVAYVDVPVTVGAWVGMSTEFTGRSSAAVTGRFMYAFITALGSAVGGGASFAGPVWNGALGARTDSGAVQVPATAAKVRLLVAIQPTANVTDPWVEFTRVAMRTGATAASVAVVPYTEPYEWLNICNKTTTIKFEHNGIGLGTLNAVVRDATLDPAVSTALRSGRLVRVRAASDSPAATYGSAWQGTLRNARTDYDNTQTNATRRARITISAVNGVAAAANTSRPQGVGTIAELAWLFETAGVPWAVNGNGTQPTGLPTYINTDPKKSLLDQVAITRDSVRGYAWVDRRGVLNVSTAAARPTALAATLTAADYTALAYDYDTARCINDVTVKVLRPDAEGVLGEVVFGPYRDAASAAQNGVYAASFTVQGLTDAQAAQYGADVLTANATPTRKVNSLRTTVTTLAHLSTTDGSKRAMLDTYDRVRITGAGGLDQTLRPTRIVHTLTPGVPFDKWTIDMEFGTDAAAAAPIQVPPPPGASVAVGAAFADTPWINATLLNGWVNFDSGLTVGGGGRPVQYRRFNGMVLLRGVMKNGASGTIAFNLPAGFRCATGGLYEYGMIVQASGGIAVINLGFDGNAVASNIGGIGGNVTSYCYVAGSTPYLAEQ